MSIVGWLSLFFMSLSLQAKADGAASSENIHDLREEGEETVIHVLLL